MEPIINLIWEAEDEKTITPLTMQVTCLAPSCKVDGEPTGGGTPVFWGFMKICN